ncbi:hypothetical protein [Thalassoroseus pseudoceratinae]|uniref:hypothetical protein n=1 Tax=Thalassoroseus pseudoceratinae TaxID=2713176 RepID=UPI0014231284|nr:hypothetical protein [Thalassoroseus pseudoceratinae]
MSTTTAENIRTVPPWVDRVADWCNPILIKEVRQSLKSRQFVVTFFLLVAGAWLTAVFGLLMWGERIEYEAAGRDFFFYFYIALAIATLVVVPFNAYLSLKSERDFLTFEVLSVTTLLPGQIVNGKLLAAVVQLFIYYSAITPFIAFASTMQGFDAALAAYLLVLSFLVSLCLCCISVTASTLTTNRSQQAALAVGLLMGVVAAMWAMIAYASAATYFRPLPFTEGEFWLVNGLSLVVAISYFILLRQIAIAQLTFETDNRSTAIRLTMTAQFWLFWIVSFVVFALVDLGRIDSDIFYGYAIVSCIHWGIFGLVMTAEPDALSRRIRRHIGGSTLWRLIKTPFMPGGARGYLLLLLNVTMIFVFYLFGVAAFDGVRGGTGIAPDFVDRLTLLVSQFGRELRGVVAICLYLVMYCGLNTALGRWGHAAGVGIKPAHARLVTFILMMAAVAGPQLLLSLEYFRQYRRTYHPMQLLDPFTTVQRIDSGHTDIHYVLPVLASLSVLAVFINFVPMVRGISTILHAGKTDVVANEAESPFIDE